MDFLSNLLHYKNVHITTVINNANLHWTVSLFLPKYYEENITERKGWSTMSLFRPLLLHHKLWNVKLSSTFLCKMVIPSCGWLVQCGIVDDHCFDMNCQMHQHISDPNICQEHTQWSKIIVFGPILQFFFGNHFYNLTQQAWTLCVSFRLMGLFVS